jgi:drug/metabolite transporter superfamily protein YnfA
MTDISRRLEQTLRSAIQKNPILPVKVDDGILVGDAKIVSEDHIKHIWLRNQLVYKEVSLNAVAIKLANMLAKNQSTTKSDAIYAADQEYGRWFIDSQMLRAQYQSAVKNKDHDRADMLWARYCESKNRTIAAKKKAEQLATI